MEARSEIMADYKNAEEFKAIVSAEFSSEKAAEAALKSLGSEREMEGRAKVKAGLLAAF